MDNFSLVYPNKTTQIINVVDMKTMPSNYSSLNCSIQLKQIYPFSPPPGKKKFF